jgi:hypothetical protein
MKIVFITEWTPTKDNYNGPSANLYHTLIHRNKGDQLYIYTSNRNKIDKQKIIEVEKELNAPIKLLPNYRSFCFLKMCSLLNKLSKKPMIEGSMIKVPKKTYNEVLDINPDIIWLYPHNLIGVAKQFNNKFRVVITGADCACLHYSRTLRDNFIYSSSELKNFVKSLNKVINTEISWSLIPNTYMLLVGYTDELLFNTMAGREYAKFFPHPHYRYINKAIDFNKNVLKVLISGKPDVYTSTDASIFINDLVKHFDITLSYQLEITFHGKQWEPYFERLKESGYNVKLVGWIESYAEFLSEFDIQILPISVGSGTKGKALDALSNGLLCIGSKIAFENIAVRPNESVLIYETPKDIRRILNYVISHRKECEIIAESGRCNVIKYHNGEYVFSLLSDWIFKNEYKVPLDKYYLLPL